MTFDLRLVTNLTIICKGTNSKKSFFTGLLPIKSQLKNFYKLQTVHLEMYILFYVFTMFLGTVYSCYSLRADMINKPQEN